MAPPKSSNFSVNVVFPASGWLIIPKVRLRAISSVNPMWLKIIGKARKIRPDNMTGV
jgi:hypothetical protein